MSIVFAFWFLISSAGGAFPGASGASVLCDLCQIFVLLGLNHIRSNPNSEPGDVCLHQAISWASFRNLSASWPDAARESCLGFWSAEDGFPSQTLSAASFARLAFVEVRERLCLKALVCNAHTVWPPAIEKLWRERAGIESDEAEPVAVAVRANEVPGPDDGWLSSARPGAEGSKPVHTAQPPLPSGSLPESGLTTCALPAGPPGDPLNPKCPLPYVDDYADLAHVRVEVVVFSGRGSRLRILLPYLRRDFRSHGGVIDRFIFALIRPDDSALELIDRMRSFYGAAVEVRDYTELSWDQPHDRVPQLYQLLNESGVVYVKIDDDIVYLEQHAIAELVREKLRHRCLFVSANIVNHAILSAVHQERGAHRAFEPASGFDVESSSRAPWVHAGDVNFSPSYIFERHPMSSCVLKRWDCAVVVHESFLDRLREGSLCVYDFGWLDFNRAGFREHSYIHLSPWAGRTWSSTGARWSINLFVFRADDLDGVDWTRVYGPGDDEEEFGGGHGERSGGHACALGRSLAVHFSYNTQDERLLRHTNLLERYEAVVAIGSAAKFLL